MTALDAKDPTGPADGKRETEFALDVPAQVEPMGRLAALDEIPAQGDGSLRVLVGSTPVGLFRVGEEIVAWRDVCPHEAASVCRGPVTGTRLHSAVYEYSYGRHQEVLHCPWHGWEFDLRSGRHLAEGSGAKLRRHPIEVRDGEVFDASGKGVRIDRELKIASVRRMGQALEIELIAAERGRLPAWQPGAHVEVALPSGALRHYSLCGDDRDRSRYRVVVLREEMGRGGSAELHARAEAGSSLHVTAVRNRFPLRFARHYLFLAAGIGITPVLPMVRAAARRNSTYQALYIGRDERAMPLAEEFAELPHTAVIETSREGRPDLEELLASCPDGAAVYCCGPGAFLDSVQRAVEAEGRGLEAHCELFTSAATAVQVGDPEPFDVRVARSGQVLHVDRDETMLAALRRAGVARPSSCESGWCGSCEMSVLEGTLIHADSVLEEDEREAEDVVMPCVSRAVGSVTVDA